LKTISAKNQQIIIRVIVPYIKIIQDTIYLIHVYHQRSCSEYRYDYGLGIQMPQTA
jgi:hypothetical protein